MTPELTTDMMFPSPLLLLKGFRIAVAAAIACVFAAGPAQANGTDPTVVQGQASFSTAGSSLNITNSPGAIINWQTGPRRG